MKTQPHTFMPAQRAKLERKVADLIRRTKKSELPKLRAELERRIDAESDPVNLAAWLEAHRQLTEAGVRA